MVWRPGARNTASHEGHFPCPYLNALCLLRGERPPRFAQYATRISTTVGPTPRRSPAAHGVRPVGFGGYQLNGDVARARAIWTLRFAPSFGAALDYRLSRPGQPRADLAVLEARRELSIFNPLYLSSPLPSAWLHHYFQIGGIVAAARGKLEAVHRVHPGRGALLPDTITFTNGSTANVSDTWRFATTLALGYEDAGISPKRGPCAWRHSPGAGWSSTEVGYYYGMAGRAWAASTGVLPCSFAFVRRTRPSESSGLPGAPEVRSLHATVCILGAAAAGRGARSFPGRRPRGHGGGVPHSESARARRSSVFSGWTSRCSTSPRPRPRILPETCA